MRDTTVRLTTAMGTVSAAFTSGTHAFVCTESGVPLSFKGKGYHTSLHLYAPDWTARTEHNPRVTRATYEDWRKMDAPPTYTKAMMSEIVRVVREYVAANPRTLLLAEVAERTLQYDRATADLTHALAECRRLTSKRDAAGEALDAAREALRLSEA